MLDRLARHSERLPKQDTSRYHFDYARLRRTSSVSAAASATT